ncbi:PRC-barrel domain-containing protein [Inquilinus sp. Marseille-Q2685]|uniref:PRC-barrel domain-containing protein n=1 Tax=Inquilinus sp. Marseille-Q2685 TaxID=2866581 RepID=UPI001CE47044|nr:PRC-barrel domain-containing protein [Inquilinus sp. Marseille-Q2685]
MTHLLRTAGMACSVVICLASAASAQPQPVAPGFPSSTPQGQVSHPPPGMLGTSLIGAKVTDTAGRGIGTITDFAFDRQGGAIRYVVVGVDQILGLSLKQVKIPSDKLRLADAAGREVATDLSEQDLKALPAADAEP